MNILGLLSQEIKYKTAQIHERARWTYHIYPKELIIDTILRSQTDDDDGDDDDEQAALTGREPGIASNRKNIHPVTANRSTEIQNSYFLVLIPFLLAMYG